jgi:hypothetical protein
MTRLKKSLSLWFLHPRKERRRVLVKEGRPFLRREDLLICSAWLIVSKDATAGQFMAYKVFF